MHSLKNNATAAGQRPRRGRPSGSNRVPLSLEERRARNALYEKQRREGNAQAFEELKEVLELDNNVSNNEVISTAIDFITFRRDDLKRLREINASLQRQVEEATRRLEEANNFEGDPFHDVSNSDTRKRKRISPPHTNSKRMCSRKEVLVPLSQSKKLLTPQERLSEEAGPSSSTSPLSNFPSPPLTSSSISPTHPFSSFSRKSTLSSSSSSSSASSTATSNVSEEIAFDEATLIELSKIVPDLTMLSDDEHVATTEEENASLKDLFPTLANFV